MVSVRVLRQICTCDSAKAESEMCWHPEQKDDGLNGEESSIIINNLKKYRKNPDWQKSKQLVNWNW